MVEWNRIDASGNNVQACHGQVASKWRANTVEAVSPRLLSFSVDKVNQQDTQLLIMSLYPFYDAVLDFEK